MDEPSVRNMKYFHILWATVLLSGIFAVSVRAGDVTCDFEKGLPPDWKLSSSRPGLSQHAPVAELEKSGENTVLELGKDALLTMGDTPYLNFSAEATIRMVYRATTARAGFRFRNGYQVYLRRPGQVELSGPNGAKSLGYTRTRNILQPLQLRIVVAGPVVRFFVNGQYEGQFNELAKTPGPVALYQDDVANNVYFDNVKLSTQLDPSQFLVCDADVGEDPSLVFDPAGEVVIKLKLRNASDVAQTARLGVVVSTFDGKPVTDKAMEAKVVPAGGVSAASFNLGKLPEGFYRLTLQPTGETLPLAVQVKGALTHDQIIRPKILTGVYWYYANWNMPPVWAYTYMHAACEDLRRHHFNTIICQVGMPTEMIEIASQYGIRCFTRGEGAKPKGKGKDVQGNVSHPNVLGGFLGDEPHEGQEERYLEDYTYHAMKYPDKLWTTCVIGDGGVASCQPWWDAWMPLSKSGNIVRMMRWYGIKSYVASVERTYAKMPPLTETLRDLSRGKGPYFFIMPSFGNKEDVDAFFSNPLPSQIRCMMHLAAAFQCKGLFFWTYQTPNPGMESFVDPATLQPLDEKWAAAGQAAGQILKNADLLATCAWQGRYRFVDGPSTLEAFELSRANDSARYFYVINTDTKRPVDGRLFKLAPNSTMQDLFTGKPVPIVEETVVSDRPELKRLTLVAKVSLAPGDGVLLRYTLPAGVVAGEEGALPRVVYPDAVSKAPAEKLVWLADVKPVEMPVPGWIPRIKYKGKAWFPDFNSHDLKLYSGSDDEGQLYKKSLYAHAETRIKYELPPDAAVFASAAGFGTKDAKASAVFRVLVDGKEKYNSGLMKLGSPVQPVVVDVAGGKRLELITEEGGDGLAGDYTFWGEARLIRK